MDEAYSRFELLTKYKDGCLLWIGKKDKDGYGMFSYEGKMMRAHRFAYIYRYGWIKDGLIVRHKCRNKCVNPEHLELGTHQDNANDRIRDGTSKKKKIENTDGNSRYSPCSDALRKDSESEP